MAVSNLIRNRSRFIRECLDEENGEFVMNGQADGSVRIIDDYDAFRADRRAKKPREYKMSLFPTNRRVVAYAARGGFLKDQFIYIPIGALREITFDRGNDGKRDFCVTEFISHQNSGYPSLVFKMDITGHPDDLEQYMLVLLGFSKLAGIEILDYTAPQRFERRTPPSPPPRAEQPRPQRREPAPGAKPRAPRPQPRASNANEGSAPAPTSGSDQQRSHINIRIG